jgi:hypothetical protein
MEGKFRWSFRIDQVQAPSGILEILLEVLPLKSQT